MTDTTPDMFPSYKTTMQILESEADIEKVGDYNEDTHTEYMRMAAWRWKRISDIACHTVCPHHSVDLRELGGLNYSVRHPASFRAFLKKISLRGPGHASKLVERIGKIARFFRSAITFTEAHRLFSRELKHFSLEFVRSRRGSISALSSRSFQHLRQRLASSPWKLSGRKRKKSTHLSKE
jgi:hypothetical protein